MLRLYRASGRLCSLRSTIKDELFIKPPAGLNPVGGWVREKQRIRRCYPWVVLES